MIDTAMPAWERRFRAPAHSFPTWSPFAPDRLVYVSNESGSYQVHTYDRANSSSRRLSNTSIGVADALPTRDGRRAVWFDDQTGDESGSWVTSPFEGGRIERLFDSSEPGWPAGIAVGRKVIAAGRSGRDGYTIEVSSDGDEPRGLHHSTYSAWVGGSQLRGGYNLGGLSPDERLLCIEHSERGDEVRPALRVLDVRTGDVVGEQWDGEGFGLLAAAWSPVPDDHRLLVRHELEDRERPAIWDLGDGTRSRLDVDLPGDVVPLDWWPDASAVLLKHSFEGRDQLYRLSLSDQRLSRLEHAGGWVDDARVRPDGDVWLEISSGGTAPRAISIARGDVLPARDRAPDGVPFTPWRFQGRAAEVHGFFATPPNERGPFPTVMYVHGGPTWLYADSFNPEAQAFVDHGFAVGMVNYRGSTGYGRTWRDSIIGDIGFPEEEDVVAGLEDLTARGIAMPGRAAIYGRSWGGFITLLSIGRRPDRWRAAVGGVPVGDYAAGYDELSPDLQAYDRYLLGGKTPHEVPELMAERSPIVYAERVRTPTLVLVGRNDSRCPYGQAMAWVHAVRAAGGDVEVYEYDSGHSSYDVDEVVRQTKLGVDFLTSHLRAE